MADVRPFQGLRYNPRKVSLERVVTQPYDKISPEMQERYYANDPHNLVRVILGKTTGADTPADNVYTRASALLKACRASGVIEAMPATSFIAYFQRFVAPGSVEERVRKGFIALGRLEDYSRKVVYPHERTLAGPKLDRLQLLRHTRTHFEQIFMLYDDPAQKIDALLDVAAAAVPDMEVTDEYGVTHTLWILDAPAMRTEIQNTMRDQKLIIADGHHRYETGLAYRDEQRAKGGDSGFNGPHEWLPMTFFNMRSPALTVLATHRVVQRLPAFDSARFLAQAGEFFDIESAPSDPVMFGTELSVRGRDRLTIGVITDGGNRRAFLSLKPIDLSKALVGVSIKERALDVVVLHRLLIERGLGITEEAVKHESNISYVRELEAAVRAVSAGGAQLAFVLNPVRLDQMRDLVYDGHVMPQKSTDFYPKVLSGLVFYALDEQ